MELTELILAAWGWSGIEPARVVGENAFGNLVVQDRQGRYWRICPEDLYCTVVATNRAELDALFEDRAFLEDWSMEALVEQAERRLGPLGPGRKYCLKLPGVLGGEYGGDNLASLMLGELISVSGHIARQVHGLPEGTHVQLRITE